MATRAVDDRVEKVDSKSLKRPDAESPVDLADASSSKIFAVIQKNVIRSEADELPTLSVDAESDGDNAGDDARQRRLSTKNHRPGEDDKDEISAGDDLCGDLVLVDEAERDSLEVKKSGADGLDRENVYEDDAGQPLDKLDKDSAPKTVEELLAKLGATEDSACGEDGADKDVKGKHPDGEGHEEHDTEGEGPPRENEPGDGPLGDLELPLDHEHVSVDGDEDLPSDVVPVLPGTEDATTDTEVLADETWELELEELEFEESLDSVLGEDSALGTDSSPFSTVSLESTPFITPDNDSYLDHGDSTVYSLGDDVPTATDDLVTDTLANHQFIESTDEGEYLVASTADGAEIADSTFVESQYATRGDAAWPQDGVVNPVPDTNQYAVPLAETLAAVPEIPEVSPIDPLVTAHDALVLSAVEAQPVVAEDPASLVGNDLVAISAEELQNLYAQAAAKEAENEKEEQRETEYQQWRENQGRAEAPTLLASSMPTMEFVEEGSADVKPLVPEISLAYNAPSAIQAALMQGFAADPNNNPTVTPTKSNDPQNGGGGFGSAFNVVDADSVLPAFELEDLTKQMDSHIQPLTRVEAIERFDQFLTTVNTLISDSTKNVNTPVPTVLANADQRIVHKVENGQTLEEIALKHFGDARYADLIYRMNMKEIPTKYVGARKLRLNLLPEMQLNLPTPQEFNAYLQNSTPAARKNFEYERRR